MYFTSFHGNPVSILHFPGKQKIKMKDVIDEFKEFQVSLPSNLTIISVITPDYISTSPLHYQLSKSNIKYINPVPENFKMWINKDKPNYVCQALKKVKTEYCLVLDGNDVVIVDQLDDIIRKFEGYGKDIIFNATSNRFPDLPVDSIDGLNDIERPKLFGPFCYLNAGCCIGRTKALKKFYKEVAIDCNISSVPSEQYHIRKVMNKHQNKVFFDYDCRIFQVFNKGMAVKLNDVSEEVLEDV